MSVPGSVNKRNKSKAYLRRKREIALSKLTIFVRGRGRSNENILYEYFSSFGRIVKWRLSQRPQSFYGFIQFGDSNAAEQALQRTSLTIGKCRLTVHRKKYKPANSLPLESNVTTEKQIIPPDALSQYVNDSDRFEYQVYDFVSAVQLGQQDVWNRENLCIEIMNYLSGCISLVNIMPFGSSMNGIGFAFSDLDLFLTLGSNMIPDVQGKGYQFEMAKICRHIHSLLLQCPFVSNVTSIPWARIPLIRCNSYSHGFGIDITFKSNQGVRNSHLLGALVRREPRLRMVLFVLKYWSKILNLTGMSCDKTMSSYALMLISLFALQQTSPPLVLPVAEMLDGIENHSLHSIKLKLEHIPPTDNDDSLVNLLYHVFGYLSDFDHQNFIVSPLIGLPLSRSQFEAGGSITDSKLAVYLKNLPTKNLCLGEICVQDIIEPNFNTTINFKRISLFKKFCRVAADICHSWIQSEHGNLLDLFDVGRYTSDSQCS